MSEGDIVWTIIPSEEDFSYEDYGPKKPCQVKITSLDIKRNLLFITSHSFNKENGEIDEDSNTTYRGYSSMFFKEYKDAAKKYIELVTEKINDLKDEIEELKNDRFQVGETIHEG